MTLRHFQIFVSVCDANNMTAAAESLYISQSAVSQAISELERHYDIRLFERLSKKLFLTEAGEKLLSYARHMLRLNADLEKDMRTLHENSTIRVGASVTVGAHLLPRLVSDFKETNPGTTVQVVEENTRQIEQLLLTDRLDFAIVEGETGSADFITEPFMEDELILICSPGHRFAGLSQVEPEDLEQEDFIVRENGSGTRKTFEDVMAAKGLSWKATWVCNNADTIRMAVAEGHGIAVISKRAAERDVSDGLLCARPVRSLRFIRTFKLVCHKNKFLTAPMKKFMDICRYQQLNI